MKQKLETETGNGVGNGNGNKNAPISGAVFPSWTHEWCA